MLSSGVPTNCSVLPAACSTLMVPSKPSEAVTAISARRTSAVVLAVQLTVKGRTCSDSVCSRVSVSQSASVVISTTAELWTDILRSAASAPKLSSRNDSGMDVGTVVPLSSSLHEMSDIGISIMARV